MNKLTRLVYASRISDAAQFDLAATVRGVLKVSPDIHARQEETA